MGLEATLCFSPVLLAGVARDNGEHVAGGGLGIVSVWKGEGDFVLGSFVVDLVRDVVLTCLDTFHVMKKET